jgi:hypothetical protein
MRCASSRWLLALLIAAACDVTAIAQVKVTLPSTHFSSEERIEARIVNSGRDALSFCVEVGQWSMHDGKVEATPTPFLVEKWTGKKWGILIGPDVGRMPVPQSLDSGAELVFPFRLGEKGRARLLLYYFRGDRKDVCDESAKRRKITRSQVFSVADLVD